MQAHVNAPFVFVQSAFESQLWVLSVHSSTSGVMKNTNEIYKRHKKIIILITLENKLLIIRYVKGTLLTRTSSSGASKASFASTCEGSVCVCAVSVGMTVMGVSGTLVYIWRYTKQNWDLELRRFSLTEVSLLKPANSTAIIKLGN